ncbi:unnamed protein product [Darwinula stevensoni]|uniref:Anaphase-promoting complex subunit 4 WD40 domain-containing protein n=1 Tax=Darwinula stevensoni TaxID=69355 RepID=A0A7R9FQ70_9CRUS|nr:unnamed protein product [Darwinula stevensoni]CAG0899202.1 unnamed protein product [Darwinula stevensoni]
MARYEADFSPTLVDYEHLIAAFAASPIVCLEIPVFNKSPFSSSARGASAVQVHSECSCAAWNEDGSLLAVGSITGHVTVLRGEDGRLVDTFVGGGSHVTCASFSPDGSQLSLGVGTGNVYIYRVDRAGNAFRRGTVLNVSLNPERLDWSTDSRYIRTQSQDDVVTVALTGGKAGTSDMRTSANERIDKSPVLSS